MIKKVKHNVFDCFFGNGWEQWVRMELSAGKWNAVSGDKSLAHGAAVFLGRKFK